MEKNTCMRVFADQNQIKQCREKVSANAKSFSQLSNILSLAGREVRLKILFLLDEENELCPCDLSDIIGRVFLLSTNIGESLKTKILLDNSSSLFILQNDNNHSFKLANPDISHVYLNYCAMQLKLYLATSLMFRIGVFFDFLLTHLCAFEKSGERNNILTSK